MKHFLSLFISRCGDCIAMHPAQRFPHPQSWMFVMFCRALSRRLRMRVSGRNLKEMMMTDPQTNTTDTNAQGTGTDTTGTNSGNGSDAGIQSQTDTSPTLEQVIQNYESALTDFDTKLAAFNVAQSALTTAAQTVAAYKQQLDTLDQQEDSKFDRVKPYLPAA
jgi:hypothetical protein